MDQIFKEEFARQRAERAYMSQILWQICRLLHQLSGQSGTPVPDWFDMFPAEKEEEIDNTSADC